ncbi:hypothetical protein [Sphingosinicella sp. BN140058]|uniref:hypothetical protein n=1 Tax=Sphingosinicella sp. BN140058 TaxID=1892855 RepID=UPI0010121BC1|nr:hypothetical protein [Sphingosinicella sp. BN140058]QAY75682.1 hypothetical protein ETR14_03415 [Sphingosinicella sp. BN140058]
MTILLQFVARRPLPQMVVSQVQQRRSCKKKQERTLPPRFRDVDSEEGRFWRASMEDAESLRAQAARCRRLAAMVTTPDVIETLRQMAREYEARADALDAGGEKT